MKNFKRLLSFVLMLCMVLSLVPAVSFGASAADSYVKTDLSAIGATDKVVITMTASDGKTYALTSSKGTSDAPTAVVVTVSGNNLSGTITNDLLWNISKSGNDLTFYPDGDTSKWLYCTATNNGVRVGTNANKVFTLDASSGYLKNTATSRYVGVYTTKPDWRCYTSTTTNIGGQTLAFYKLEAGNTPDPEYTVTFSTPDGVTAPNAVTASSVTLPSLDSYTVDGKTYEFVGWTTDTYTDTTTKPATVANPYKPAGNITLKALYAWSETTSGGSGGDSFNLVTSADGISTGSYVVVVDSDKAGYFALKKELVNSSYVRALPADSLMGSSVPATITVTDSTLIWTLTGSASGLTLTDGTNSLNNSNNNLYYNTNAATTWTATASGTNTFKLASGGKYLGLRDDLTTYDDAGNPRFRCNSSSSTSSYLFYLYKQAGSTSTTTTYWTTEIEITDAPCTHSITATTRVEATCTAAGSVTVTCSACGEVISTTTIPKIDHSFTNGTCSVCGEADPNYTPETTDYSGRYYIATNRSSGNYWYMTNSLGTASTKRYQAEDSGLTTLPATIETPVVDKVFVIERNEDGTYCIYAEGVEGDNYLGWSSGKSGILVAQEDAKNVTITGIGDGLVNIFFATSSEDRYLSLNGTSGNNYFAWYEGTQRQDLTLIPVDEGYTVTLVCPDGASAESVTAATGASVQLPVPTGSPANSGYTYSFYGWASRMVTNTATLPSIVTVYMANESVSFTEDTTLFALYTYVKDEKTYYTTITPIVISFVCPDGVTADAIYTTTGTIYTMPTPTGEPANNVYDFAFVGWVQKRYARTEEAPSYTKAEGRYYATTSLTYYPLFSVVANEKTYYTTINPMTVTFSCPMGVSAETIHTTTGTVYTIPAPKGTPSDAAREYTFAGWVTSPLMDTSTAPTTIIVPGDRYGALGNMKYYALYTYTQDSATVYTTYVERNTTVYRINSMSELIPGNYLLMVKATGTYKKHPGYYMLPMRVDGYNCMSSAGFDYETVPAALSTVSTVLWTMNVAADGMVTIQDPNGYYLTDTSDADGLSLTLGTTAYNWTPNYENGTFTLKSTDGRYLSLRDHVDQVDSYGDPFFCVIGNIAASSGSSYFYLYKENCFHTETTTETVAPTCTATGSETVICNTCGATVSTTVLPATGHSFVDSGEDRDGKDVYVCSVCGVEELRNNITATIKIITGEGTAWLQDSAGNVYPLYDDNDKPVGNEANEKAKAYRAEVPMDSTVVLVLKPDSDQRLACIEQNADRLNTDAYAYDSTKGYFTYSFTATDDKNHTGVNNYFRITFLPRLADGGYIAEQASEAKEGDFITPGLYMMTGVLKPETYAANNHSTDTTYLLYGDEYTVLDDDLKAVGRKSSALQLASVGVFLSSEEPYRMTAVNKNHLLDIQPSGEYFTIEVFGARNTAGDSENRYFLKSLSSNNLATTTDATDEAALWKITYEENGAYKIVNNATGRTLLFNYDPGNLQFRAYASNSSVTFENCAPVLYRATKASQLVTYSVASGRETGSIRAINTSTASAIASGTYQAIDSVLTFSFTPAFGYLLERVAVNGVTVDVIDGSYTCTVKEGENIDVKVWYKEIPADRNITVNYYVNGELKQTVTALTANTYVLDIATLDPVEINGVYYTYDELSFSYAENGSVKYADLLSAILVEDGDTINAYFSSTEVNLKKTAEEITDKNYTVDDTNGGLNGENFTDNNGMDVHGNVKQSFRVTLEAQSFDKGEDIILGTTDVIVVLDNSNSMYERDTNGDYRRTVTGYLSAESDTQDFISISEEVSAYSKWSIGVNSSTHVANIKAAGGYTHNTIAFDATNKVFSAYLPNSGMGQVILVKYNSTNNNLEYPTSLTNGDLVFICDSSMNYWMDSRSQDDYGRFISHEGTSVPLDAGFVVGTASSSGTTYFTFSPRKGTEVSGATNSEYTLDALETFYNEIFETEGNRVGIVKFNSYSAVWNGSEYIAYNGSTAPSSYSSSGVNYSNCFMTDIEAAKAASTKAIGIQEPDYGGTNFVGAWLMTQVLAMTRSNVEEAKNRDLVIVFFTDGQPTFSYAYNKTSGTWSTDYSNNHHALYAVNGNLTVEGLRGGGQNTSAAEFYYAMLLAQNTRAMLESEFGDRVSIHNIALLNDPTQNQELVKMLMSNNGSEVKQWNASKYDPLTSFNHTLTDVSLDITTWYTYGDLGEYMAADYWTSVPSYADSYVPVTGDVSNSLGAAFEAIAETVIPGKKVRGTIEDIIPADFILSKESEAKLLAEGWKIGNDENGNTVLRLENVVADADGEMFTYDIQYQGNGYGTVYTNVEAKYSYEGIDDNIIYDAYFPMPAVDVIPWTVNDGYTADTNVAVTLDLFKNDLFEELTAGSYTVGNLSVTLTDAYGNPTTYMGAQVGAFDAVVDPASNTVSFMTETGGTHTFYYVVSAEVTDPDGKITTVYSRATRVDVLTVTAQNVSDLDVVMAGDKGTIDLLANDSFDSGDNKITNHVVLTDANGNTLDDDLIPSITDVTVEDPATGELTYTAVESGVAQFWYVNTITAKSESGDSISVSTPPTKVTILVVDNAALVVDYGYTTEAIRVHPDLAGYTVSEGVSLSQVVSITYTDVTDQFGTAAFSDGSFQFTPKTTMFGGTAVFSYDVTMEENPYSIRTANYSPTVTVVPANSIYFEESFLNYAAVGGEDKALAGWTNANDEPADERLQSNENKLYGYDNAYLVSETYSGGSAKLATVDAENHTAVAYFTFSGTGFDLYGLSSVDTGFLLAEIYTYDSKNENGLGTLKKYVMVDTYIKGKYYDQLPILCYRVAEPDDYAVKLRVVYERAFDHNLVATKSAGIRDEDYYRQLLGLQEGIPMELNLSESTVHATRTVPNAELGSYSVVIDGIRVYQPLGANPADTVANKLYDDAGELGMSFFRLRDLLLNSEEWVEGDAVNGLVYIAAHGNNSQTSGFATNAPESSGFYMTPTQLLKLDENNYLIHPTTKAPFLYKNETDGQEYEVFVVIVEGADGGYRYDFCYKNSLDETVVIPAEEIEEAGLMHSENYYEAIGPKYELYLTNGNGVAFDVNASTVHISAKVPVGTSANLMAYVDGAWSKVATVSSRTELYFDVSEYINSDGSLIIKCEAEGDAVLSLCNLKTSGTTSISRRTFCNAAVAINGLKVNESEAPMEATDLVFESKSLSLRSYIAFNCFVSGSVLANYDSWYVVFERYDYNSGDVVAETVLGTDFFGASYQFEYKVNSYQMSDTITATLYAVKDGKTYVGETYTNSVANYVYSNIEFAENDAHTTLYANLVTYGAKAQLYMNYNTENLADANLGKYASYVTTAVPAAENVFSQAATKGFCAVTLNRFALGISSAVEIQVILNQPVGCDMADLYGEMTFVNSSGETVTQRLNGTDFDDYGVVVIGRFDALTAVDGRTPVEITIYDQEGNAVSDTWTYSIASYLDGTTLEGDALATLYALVNYFDSAAAYFNG